jgi:predicted dehydrogenase
VPAGLAWDLWLGVAPRRPFVAGYYHPGIWRKRLDFGTGTFGDMGCHILDPVFASLALTAPATVRSEGGAPNGDSWGLDSQVRYVFPGTDHTTDELTLTWYDGERRPPTETKALIGDHPLSDQGSIYIGTEGVLYSPYIAAPVLAPGREVRVLHAAGPGRGRPLPPVRRGVPGPRHDLDAVQLLRPLTESVLLGCLATRFPMTTLEWDAANLKVTNVGEADRFVRRRYREGWEMEGL